MRWFVLGVPAVRGRNPKANSMSILKPLKLYLDTNHLINIAKVRKGTSIPDEVRPAYLAIDECIRNRHVGVIFEPAMTLEWVDGNATLESAYEIADVIESAKLQYEIEIDTFVYLHEVLCELKRLDSSLCLPEYEIMHVRIADKSVRRALGVLRSSVPEFFDEGELLPGSESLPIDVPFSPVRWHVERSWKFKHERNAAFRERVDGHAAAYEQDLDSFRERNKKPLQTNDMVDWMKRFLKVDRILRKLNADVDVDHLLRSIKIERCPAVDLFTKAHEKRIRAGNTVKDNDSDDWSSVAVVPYADVVLTERNLRAFLIQANPNLDSKVTHDPRQAMAVLVKWFEN